jgi:t-SNARE complex subunit (syntaxin)
MYAKPSGSYTLAQQPASAKITDSPTHQRLQEREEEIRRTEQHLENLKSQLSQSKTKLLNDNLQTQSQSVIDSKFSQSAYTKPKNTSLQNPYY